MELRLQKFVNSMVTLSDIRNLDLSNPVVFNLEHPVTALRYTVVVAEAEPSYMGIPVNTTWVVINISSAYHLQCLKLVSTADPAAPIPGVTLVPGMRQSWKTISNYSEIFDTQQYYDNGASGGVRGPKGDTGPMGYDGLAGPTGQAGATPVIDYEQVIQAVIARLPPPTGAAPTLSITGPATVLEGQTAQYLADMVLGTESYPLNLPIALATTAAASISTSRLLTAGSVAADTDISLSVSIVNNGQTITAQKTVRISNSVLSSIAVTGLPSTLYEGRTAQLSATAAYNSGSSTNVTALTTFTVSAGAGTVSASGLFTANLVAVATPFTVTVSYTENGVTKSAIVGSSVLNNVPASLTTTGPSAVAESTTAQYTCTVVNTDGTSATVSPAWAIAPASAGSISAYGLFTASAVAADVSATITATYLADGVVVTSTHAVTVTNVATIVYPYFGSAPVGAAINEALILGLGSRGPVGSRMNPNMQILDSATTSLYYAYPVSYGPATFTDLGNGFQGGWDGAHKDSGNTAGPVTVSVTVAGVPTPFYVYQADYPNISPAVNPTNWSVT